MLPPPSCTRVGSARAWTCALVLLGASAARAEPPASQPGSAPQISSPAAASGAETAAAPVPAAPPCVFERYISVVSGAGFDPHLAEEVRKDLAAELAPRGFGVCPGPVAQGELVAAVTLVQPEPALVAIQVEDRATGKRVARDVRLARIPEGGVALAIAIAADELLRASWAELMLRRRDRAEALAREPQPVVESDPVSPETRRFVPWRKRADRVPAVIALAVDYAHSLQHWDGFGLELRLQLRPFRYGFFELGGGGVIARPVQGELGTARAAGALALLTVGGCGEPNVHVVLCGGARATFQWTRFRGTDAQRAKGGRGDASSLALSAVGQAQLRVAPHFVMFAELSLGAVPVAALAKDRDGTLIGVQGLLIGAALGAGYAP